MSNNVSSFQEDDWIDDSSEIQIELDQTEIEEIEYLCRDYLKGEIIPGYFKLKIFWKNKVQWKFSKVFKKYTEFNHYICLMNWILCILCFEHHKVFWKIIKNYVLLFRFVVNKLMLIDGVLQVLFTRFRFTKQNYDFDWRKGRLYFLILQRYQCHKYRKFIVVQLFKLNLMC